MKKRKLDALLWEQNIFDNFIIGEATNISQENLDDVLFEYIDELGASREIGNHVLRLCGLILPS